MDKEQALHSFWNSFGIPAYDETSVPDGVSEPYITYSVATGSLGDMIALTATIWYRGTSWADVTQKKNQIAEAISFGGKLIEFDGGSIWLTRGYTFAQRLSGQKDSVRAYYLQLNAEFFTEN